MAKINISFNDKNYQVDEASLQTAVSALQSHLSSVMNGTGATINFGGTAYSIDSTKLSTATSDFISHLGTVSGSGYKVMVGGVEYGVDSTKMAGAVTELETVLAGLNNPDAPSEDETLEGDGQEFHKFAPTALTFRSTAPLNELQEVQINGVTVDPSNYITEEGSTVITLPIGYLKTLDVDNYEITVVSDSKSAKGGFSVVQPELNEHGFYYNQPYTAYVAYFGENESFFIREGGVLDVVGTPSGDVSQCTYTIDGSTMTVVSPVIGTLTATVSDDGTEIYCNELQISFKLGDESIVSDEDYIYIYHEAYDCYTVSPINAKKSSYSPIKTGINGKVTYGGASFMFNENLIATPVAPYNFIYAEGAFRDCVNLESVRFPDGTTYIPGQLFEGCTSLNSVTIPAHITEIKNYVFWKCANLTDIRFEGTVEQWNTIKLGETWNLDCPATYVQCSDGQVALV